MSLSNTVSALTKEKFMPILVDNIFNSNALCLKLLKNADLIDGGVKINVPVEHTVNANSDWLVPGDAGTTGVALTDIASKAVYDWATAYNSIIISSDEKFINSGDSAVISMLKAKMRNAEKTIKDLFGTGMFNATAVTNGLNTLNGAGTYDGGGVGSNLQGFDNSNGLTTGTLSASGSVYYLPEGAVPDSIVGFDRSLGGIDTGTSGTNDYWNSNLNSFEWSIGHISGNPSSAEITLDGGNDAGEVSFANFCATTAGVAGGIKAMTQMYGACSIDADQPDLIVTTQVIYDAYETALQANKRYSQSDNDLADAGFGSLAFRGASIVVDSHCPAGHMYFLNTKYLDFKVHSGRNFAFEDYKAMEQKDALQARIFWMGQLVCSNPRMQGLLVGGPSGY